MAERSVLVTLTAPSCAGKSHLLSYIRDEQKIPCLISTTTRPPRAGEVEGVDYFFISEADSKDIEAQDGFAELAVYNGIRYGVTKEEFKKKLDTGLTFLIVEPSGIDHYVKPALDVGAIHLKYFITAPQSIRLERFKKRLDDDLGQIIHRHAYRDDDTMKAEDIRKCVEAGLKRYKAMLTVEPTWIDMAVWDGVLSGLDSPEHNLAMILGKIQQMNLNNI
jgi:guanylate kinase